MTFKLTGLEEIKRWVLGLGTEAEVLEHPRLIELMREDLTRTLGQYYKTAPAIGRSIQGISARERP